MATSSSSPLSSEDIFNKHHPFLSASLCDPVSVTRLLYGELVITGQILSKVESASPSVTKQREELLKGLQEVLVGNGSSLQTFASVLCKFTANVKLGEAIHKDYDESSIDENEITWETNESGCIAVPKRKSDDFTSFHELYIKMFQKLTDTIKGHAPAIQDIKSFIECFTSQLEGQLLVAESINDQLLLMRSSSNLIDIEMLQGLTEHLQLPDGKKIISEYQEAMMEYASKIPVRLCTTENLNTIMTPPPLKCESATFAFSWKPEEKKLKDAVDIVSKSTGKLMKVRSIELSGDEVHVNCVFLYTLMGAAIATVHDNIEVLIKDGIVKVTIGYLTVWKKQVHDILTKEREDPPPSEETPEDQDTSSASLDEDKPKTTAELEDIVEKLSETLKDKEQEVEELADILQKIKEGTPLERKVSELKLLLKQEKEKEKNLRDEIKEMEEALKDPEAYEKKRLTNELERLKREKKQKEDKLLEEGKKEISVLKEKLKELEKELAEKEEENRSLTENLKALQSQLTETKPSETDDPPQPLEEPAIPTSSSS